MVLSVLVIDRHSCTGGAQSLVAGTCAPVSPSLATPLFPSRKQYISLLPWAYKVGTSYYCFWLVIKILAWCCVSVLHGNTVCVLSLSEYAILNKEKPVSTESTPCEELYVTMSPVIPSEDKKGGSKMAIEEGGHAGAPSIGLNTDLNFRTVVIPSWMDSGVHHWYILVLRRWVCSTRDFRRLLECARRLWECARGSFFTEQWLWYLCSTDLRYDGWM